MWAAAVMGGASGAWATHPDHEGERGVEMHVAAGYGLLTTASDRVFLDGGNLSDPPLDAFTGGFNARLGVGYRLLPYLSAGVSAGVQFLGAQNQFVATERSYGASDSFIGYTVGVYGRLYLGSLLNGSRTEPRVFFRSATDPRRFDPFVSLGLEFVQGVQRSRSYAVAPYDGNLISWTTTYVGIPVTVGAEYRLLTQLAVGASLGFTPLVAATTAELSQQRDRRPGIDEVTRTSREYTPDAAVNFNLWFGLTARYTLTF